MTTDYSRPHRGVAYFGVWAAETADDYGRRDAIAILTDAVSRCIDEDMREHRETCAALAYLTREGHGKRAAAFRRALNIEDAAQRRQQARQAVETMIAGQRPLPLE